MTKDTSTRLILACSNNDKEHSVATSWSVIHCVHLSQVNILLVSLPLHIGFVVSNSGGNSVTSRVRGSTFTFAECAWGLHVLPAMIDPIYIA